MRAKTVDAPRHQCFGETKHIQILRSHFDEKCEHKGARNKRQQKLRLPATHPCQHKFYTETG
jgi:hypothetical protein